MKTSQLTRGMTVKLAHFGETAPAYRQRLLAMGLTHGVLVDVVRRAPLGCPLQIAVRGAHIALRREEADALCWEPV